MPDGHVAEKGDFEGGGDVEDIVRDDDLGPCNKGQLSGRKSHKGRKKKGKKLTGAVDCGGGLFYLRDIEWHDRRQPQITYTGSG